ncbi:MULTISPECIES: hypothetical protein [unclassified Butyrivibrio]|uniref:hypothetical protein n=1 Tax=unclassified Butyrivibrio TaxID=2639466 RepID=UPI0003B66219|nr:MULTISPECIES: hypothetical protein [unclassified Butyrivibrio]MDC7293998.1 hypothetical protein [Butyrivibrio sp. DSM 10294]
MGGNELLNILIQSIKSKLTGLVTKIRLYTSWAYVKTRIVIKIRDFFVNLLGIKPRNKEDYFNVGRWMLSKRLIYAAVIMIGVLSIWYISSETTLFKNFSQDGIKTYKYNSLRLRTAKGHVKITGKSGYLAYDGNVENGYANGEGVLYNPAGNAVYIGTFEQNDYEGYGTENYPTGSLHYIGDFHDCYYEGKGTLYRENGTREYYGDFFQGKKNGTGTLYDVGENEIYSGSFSADNIVYSELLGKNATEVNECYKGHSTLYVASDESVVVMDEINALYRGVADEDALDDEVKVDSVYVLQNFFNIGNESIESISDLKDALGEPIYQGNSEVVLPEAVAINLLGKKKNIFQGPVKMDLEQTFSDVAEVNSFDRDYSVYIYTFLRGEIAYSFVCKEKSEYFEFYYLSNANDDDAM